MTIEEEEKMFEEDTVIVVKMPRKDYAVMKQLIKERQTMNSITAAIKSSAIWVVVGGVLTCWYLWDKVRISLFGA
jgi:uncharacterized membrane protein